MTKKYVIAGGPSIGKTTVLEILASRGYITVPESARAIIAEEQAKDGDALPWRNNAKFQKRVMDHQLKLEEWFDQEEVFLDRGLVDGVGYCTHFGTPLPEGMAELGKGRYDKVFILDRLPEYKQDAERLESPEEGGVIHQTVIDGYLRFGYEPIMVPVLPPEERVEYILARI